MTFFVAFKLKFLFKVELRTKFVSVCTPITENSPSLPVMPLGQEVWKKPFGGNADNIHCLALGPYISREWKE